MVFSTTPSSRFPRAAASKKHGTSAELLRVRFELPTAPRAFRSILWEAEFSSRGVARLSLLSSQGDDAVKLPALPLEHEKHLKSLKKSLLERLKGGRIEMDWNEFDLEGAGDFHQRVWKAMLYIPFGETATYAEVARDAGSPLAFRACGQACGANRILIFIPCHRVVSSTGLGGFGYGLDWKKNFLAMEQQ